MSMAENSTALDGGPPPDGLVDAVDESMQPDEQTDQAEVSETLGASDDSTLDAGPPPPDLVAEISGELDDADVDEED